MAENVAPNPNLMLQAADALNACDVPWMLTGSFATNLYAIPRFTADADFVVRLQETSLADIVRHMGEAFSLEPQMTFETNTSTTRHILRHEREQFTIEFFELSDDPHDQQRFQRRKAMDYYSRTIYIPTAEDVIITKLRWSAMSKRPKDLDDAYNVIEEQLAQLDWEYLQKWCSRHGTDQVLTELRSQIGDSPA